LPGKYLNLREFRESLNDAKISIWELIDLIKKYDLRIEKVKRGP